MTSAKVYHKGNPIVASSSKEARRLYGNRTNSGSDNSFAASRAHIISDPNEPFKDNSNIIVQQRSHEMISSSPSTIMTTTTTTTSIAAVPSQLNSSSTSVKMTTPLSRGSNGLDKVVGGPILSQSQLNRNLKCSKQAQLFDEQSSPHLAPLASLDLSITDNLSENQQSSTPTETPTLSGYFDCDELSDMIDDSLFEITNTGCLSKTIFAKSSQQQQNNNNTTLVNKNKIITIPNNNYNAETIEMNNNQSIANNFSKDIEDRSESLTPTNEHQSVPIKKPTILSELEPIKSQIALLANYQPYDYSSTSSIPIQTRLSNGFSTAKESSGASLKQRSKSAHSNANTNNTNNNDNGQHLKVRRSQRKSRSNPDVRDEMNSLADGDSSRVCSLCRDQDLNQGIKKKRRFTFSLFNLFGGGGNSANNNNSSDTKLTNEIDYDKRNKFGCIHMQQSSSMSISNKSLSIPNNKKSGSGNLLSSAKSRPTRRRIKENNSSQFVETEIEQRHRINSIPTKTRDSIRLTNQRKQRKNNNNNFPLSNSYADFNKQPRQELLLDVSIGKIRNIELRPTQSSFSLSHNSSNANGNSNNDNGNVNGNDIARHRVSSFTNGARLMPSSGSNDSQLSTSVTNEDSMIDCGQTNKSTIRSYHQNRKSVKFSMPDRIMVMSNKSLTKPSGSNLPTAGLQPSAPIIKRPNLKLSNYSQTESSKSLDEMLAKYEDNSGLILEINEKLKLTETIASPHSILDQEPFDHEEEEKSQSIINNPSEVDNSSKEGGNLEVREKLNSSQEQLNSGNSYSSSTSTSYSSALAPQSIQITDDQQNSNGQQFNTSDSALVEGAESFHHQGGDQFHDANGDIQIASGTSNDDADEAELSKDWSNKQIALE